MAIPTRIDVTAYAGGGTGAIDTGCGSNYIVETPLGVNYLIYMDSNNDPAFKKSLDGGMTWGTGTALKNCTCTQIAVWYDRWSGIAADLIHVAYTDSDSDDVFYRNIDAANSDTLGTEYVLFSGASTALNVNTLSIARMRGGNLICAGTIDGGTENVGRKSTDVGINWTNITSLYEAVGDQVLMMPGWAADNQDGICFYWDVSANEISVKYYDDSGNSWSEQSLGTSMVWTTAQSTRFQYSAAVDLILSQNILIAWSAFDTANADLRCWKVTEAARTEVTNVILNSGDDQAGCAISISPTNDWYVFYMGNSAGTETIAYPCTTYYKKSTDQGATWGSETLLSNTYFNYIAFFSKPIHYKSFGALMFCYVSPGRYIYNAPLAIPHSTFQLGM